MSQKICESCGTKKGIRQFYPPYEQLDDDEYVYFCESCFLSDDIQCDEPMTSQEKMEEWIKAIPITVETNGENKNEM